MVHALMAYSMRQELRMSQQLVMTPQLQQAIKLLQLSRIELQDLVRGELLENPLLDDNAELGGSSTSDEQVSSIEMQDSIEQNAADQPAANKSSDERSELKVDDGPKDNFDWEAYLESNSYAPATGPGVSVGNEDLPSLESTASRPETLTEHLEWQVRLSDFSPAEEEIRRAHHSEPVGGRIPARGFGPVDFAAHGLLGASGRGGSASDPGLRPHVRSARATLAEALWVQANHPDEPIEDPLVLGMICKHLDALEKRAYPAIARDMGEQLEEIYEAAKVIMALEPRPARAFASEEPHYIVPDVYIQKISDEWVVTLNDDGLPKLKISGMYRAAMSNSREAKEYISERLRSAQWLIRSIQQRTADDSQSRQEHSEVPAPVLRQGRRAPAPADPQGRRRGHLDARVHGQPRHDQQVRAHAAGHLRAQVLLQRRDQSGRRRRALASEAVKTKIKAI